MDRYLTWNDALAKRFFHPGVEGAPVYFFVTEDVITEVGRTIGKSYEDFLSAPKLFCILVYRNTERLVDSCSWLDEPPPRWRKTLTLPYRRLWGASAS